ncbi:MAG: FAD:protein FMN transferase [Phycisphaerales bacterium]|nr:FAD:protein FMN transferase [Phycisphaerales bacterium]
MHQSLKGNRFSEDFYAPLAFDAMGCRFEIIVDVNRSPFDQGDCIAVCEDLRELVFDWHSRLSVFEPGSIISQINRSNSETNLVLDDDMYSLISMCEDLRIETGGMFNIAAGSLMQAHGFQNESLNDLAGLDLNKAFELDPKQQSIQKIDNRIALDFGAIAKGFVLDEIKSELIENGITNAFVHGGTSSATGIGLGQHNKHWRVDIGNNYFVELNDLSIGVSENISNTISKNGIEYGHVMNPQTLASVDNNVSRVVCIHRSATIADAYSTACCVSPSLKEKLNNDSCSLIVFENDEEPTIFDPLGVVRTYSEDCYE